MLDTLHRNDKAQVVLGLLIGIGFGFLLQKGNATKYDVIIGQLLLTDFTVLKLMLSAVIVGMVGFHLLRHAGYVRSHAASGSIGSNVVGGLIFGVGFALLGYCPGTVAGAAGTGALDALAGGMTGMVIGAGFFVGMYPRLRGGILSWKTLPAVTVPEYLHLNLWYTVILMEALMIGFLVLLACIGL